MIKAEYIDHMGDDLRVANAARVSFARESDWVQRPYADGDNNLDLLDEELPPQFVPYDGDPVSFDDRGRELSGLVLSARDSRLIAFLARENHFTPFAHCMITLRETVPIFVARQRFKHVVGFSYNEVSRRYVDDEPEFYEPDVWRKRAENVKQGSSDDAAMDGEWHNYRVFLEDALELYRHALEIGIAPEQARMVLPQSMLTSYYVTGSLAAFARAYKLRTDQTAQREIQDLAAQWDTIIRPLFPVSWAALVGDEQRQVTA